MERVGPSSALPPHLPEVVLADGVALGTVALHDVVGRCRSRRGRSGCRISPCPARCNRTRIRCHASRHAVFLEHHLD
eukprot:13941100-Heterocapsa_arctica.AAC.1